MRRGRIRFARKRIREEKIKSASCFTSGVVVCLGTEWHADSVKQRPRHGKADKLKNSGKTPYGEYLYTGAEVGPTRNFT